jgi:hypothetical protein
MLLRRSIAPAALAAAALLACGGSGSEGALGLAPQPGAVVQTALDIVWSIQEASGCGSITSAGVYSAPSTATTCHVVARLAGDASKTSVATVNVAAAPTPTPTPTPQPATGGDAISSCAKDRIRTTGTITYVCNCDAGADAGCASGNDSNPGTSPSAPKRSFAAAQAAFRAMNAGDTVAFCKGGRWNAVTTTSPHWANARCRADSTCDARAYDPPGTSGRARPYLDVMGDAVDFSNASSAGTAGYRFQGLGLHGHTGGNNWGFFFSQNVDDVLICDNVIDGFDIAIHLRNQAGMADRVNFVSNTVTHSGGNAYLGGTNYGRVENNTFDDNGQSMFDHNIYLAAPVAGMVVRGNHSTRSAGLSGQCSGAHIAVHGQFDSLVIENNVIEESGTFAAPGCWGIGVGRDSEVPSGSILPESFRNVSIRNNILRNIGNVMISVDQCQNCVVENNLVIPNPGYDQSAIRVGATPPQTGTNGTDANVSAVKVRNNTVYAAMNPAAGATVNGIWFASGDGGHEIYNNAVYITGAGGTCIVPAGTIFNSNNACTMAATGAWFNAAGTDFTPGPSSPLLNAGTTRNGQAPTTDLTGAPRDAAPDVGAYERR